MRKKGIKERVEQFSEGLLAAVTDFLLFNLYFFGASLGKGKSSRAFYQAVWEANDLLANFDYRTIREAIKRLKRSGFISMVREGEITAAGRRRLERLLPQFEEKRLWDGSLYLVTYDIPEGKKEVRDKLRGYLLKMGMGRMHQSVWITSYNPTKILEEFVEENGLQEETIVVSKIGRDGFVGKGSLKELVEQVYGLAEINREYGKFLKEVEGGKRDRFKLALRFLSILKRDPQLPWELLPDDWLGKEAWLAYQRLLGRRGRVVEKGL